MSQETATMQTGLPANVPPDLVVDLDFYAMAGPQDDIFAAWQAFADRCRAIRGGQAPIVWTHRNGGHWIAATGRAVEELFADVEHLSNRSISIPSFEGVHILPGEGDGEEHSITRIAAIRWFTPQRVRGLAGPIRTIAAGLIEEFRAKGECDFMSDFALKIPMHLFFEMMALPLSDGRMLLDAAEAVIREGVAEKKIAAMHGVFDYLGAVIDQRTPNPGDDLISALILSDYKGGRMPRELVLSISVNLLMAGLDTVASMLGFVVRHLAGDDRLRRELAGHPERIRSAVEEFARRFPVASLGRVVARDFAYGGVTFKQGDRLFMPTALHSLDDSVYPRAGEVDIDRNPAAIMSFGRGPHQCLGALLARIELAEALTEWLRQIPEFRLTPGKPPTVSCGHITAMTSLPLSWDPRG
jgi:cytochrome P450